MTNGKREMSNPEMSLQFYAEQIGWKAARLVVGPLKLEAFSQKQAVTS